MKRIYLMGKIVLVAFFVAGLGQACTNLDEQLYDTVSGDNFPKTQEDFVSALGTAYSSMSGYASGAYSDIQEVTTDEVAVPTRGQDWDDGGAWRRLHLHSWNREQSAVNDSWNFLFTGVNNCNRNIALFESLIQSGSVDETVATSYINELKVLRCFFYVDLVDAFGNVPYITTFFDAPSAPPTVPRAQIFDNLVQELNSDVPTLTKDVDATTYGRVNYWVGKMIQAKLYLNAEIYSGEAHWDDCIAACDEIINSGKFELTTNYFDNFAAANTGTSEMIFAIPYDQVYLQGFNLDMQTLHYGNQDTYRLTDQPWNGYCTLQEFYDSYSDNDLRKGDPGTLEGPAKRRGNFIAGYQYKADGTMVTDGGWEQPDPSKPEKRVDPDGAPLNFLPSLATIGPSALREEGARIGKWEFAQGATSNMSNDFAVYRYADVLLMKAEALARKNNSPTDATALALVNQVRERAGVDDLTTLNGPISFDKDAGSVFLGELFNERGREMFYEKFRRSDLIRFGLFTHVDKWALPTQVTGDFMVTDEYTNLYPIPRAQTDANPNLQQNNGY